MRSRRLLWCALLIGAVPLLLEATTGCDLIFDLEYVEQDPDDNAFECACSCEATAARTQRIAATADDAEEDGTTAVQIGTNGLHLGDALVGLRFTGLSIKKGTKIAHAYVEFTGRQAGETDPSNLTITAEDSASPAAFSATDADLSGRTDTGTTVSWTSVPAFDLDVVQRSPEIGDLLQEAVDRADWTESSAFVLFFDGAGLRTAHSFDGNSDRAPQLIVDIGVGAELPICAGADAVVDSGHHITPDSLVNECNRVATTLNGLASACGYPTPCSCSVVNQVDPSGTDRPDSTHVDSCALGCTPQEVDAPACDTFDPNAYADCVEDGGTLESCKAQHVSATHASGGTEVCVSSGSPLAFHAFGERSLCAVGGSADIVAGDRRPTSDPATAGTVEILGRPCVGTDCNLVHPYFNLVMNPIEFEVRWASNPVFRELAASGTGLEAAQSDTGGATFDTDQVAGAGLGRRGGRGLGIGAKNPEPLDLGVDWIGRTCDVHGTLAAGTGDDGLCEADGTTPCATDDDCVAVGGVCVLPPPTDQMQVTLDLFGQIVNEPPLAAAGADQDVECTSPDGASFALDGRGTSDADANLALSVWREGTRTGPELGRTPVVTQSLGVGESQSYVLRVVDTLAQTDEDTTTVEVVDTTPPVIACNAPATIKPPDAEISFTATATDVCDADVAAQVQSYDCFAIKRGKRVSKLESCVVSFTGSTVTIHDVGGYGDHVTWTVGASDDTGNNLPVTCEVVVTK
jgi:hypothetical protein